MGFKKYEEGTKKEEEVLVEEETKKEEQKKEYINNLIEENTRISEEENKQEKTIDEEKVYKDVELARFNYNKILKKWKILGICSSCFGIALMVVAMVLFFAFKDNQAVTIVALVLCVLGIIAMGVVSVIKNKDLKKKALNYVNEYFVITNKFIYSDDKFSNVQYLAETQYSDEAFKNAHLYKGIHDTKSRNYVTLNYKDRPLVSCDISANVLVKGRTSPMFLGKLYCLERKHDEAKEILEKKEGEQIEATDIKKDVIIFQLKGGDLSRPIDDVEGLEKIDETNTYVLYSNNKKCKKIFNSKVLTTCMAFRIDKTLIDVVISITNEYITIGIDYADDFISIPVESETNVQTLRRTKKDLELVTEIFDFVNENSK